MAGLFDDLVPQQSKPAQGGAFADLVPGKPAAPSQRQDAPSGFLMGVADPIHGGAQLLTKILPEGVVQAGNQFNNWLADNTGLVARLPEGGVDQLVREREQDYAASREAAGETGVDWGRIAGNVVSPANIAVGAAAPVRAATIGKMAMQGARAGAAGASLAPVTGEDGEFWNDKAAQVAAGAAGGAVITPVAGKLGERVVRQVVKPSPQSIAQRTDEIVNAGIERLQREGVVLPENQVAALRQQVASSLQNGVEIDAAALARKADFDALGMQPTMGQITRDAAQFAREKNLRGVAGVGEPLLSRLDDQSRRIQELVARNASGAADDYTAGNQIIGALRGVDDEMSKRVGAAYNSARDSAGRAANMDRAFFSREANAALDRDMLGTYLPAEVRNMLNELSVGQKVVNGQTVDIPFNVNSAVQIDSILSKAQRAAGMGTPQALAISRVRDALNSTPIENAAGQQAKQAFDVARGLARERFKVQEMVPALKAAVDGDVAAQDFTRRFLINGKADEVVQLAKTLPQEAKEEARRQFGAALERAAFGANVAGDKGFAQESFNRFLRQPGMRQKMAAFFSPDEIAQFERIGRVGAYINSFPANAAVNTSNTAAALANLVSRVPGLPAGIGLLQSAKNAAGNQMAVNSALRANPAQRPSSLTPEQLAFLSRFLGGGAAGSAGAAGVGIGD